MYTNTIEYKDGDTLLEGYIAYDETKKDPKPTVLVAPTYFGRDEFACAKAEMLAELGYVGFAIDMYGKGILGKNREESANLKKPLMDNRRSLQERILTAYHFIQTLTIVDKHRLAAIGYCFGGLCALDLARSGANLKGVVTFHGLLEAPQDLPNQPIQAKILVLHGHDDPLVPPEQVTQFEKEMTGANVDWQIHIYGNTMHAFTNPNANDPDVGTVYHSLADQRSKKTMENFLQEIFKD